MLFSEDLVLLGRCARIPNVAKRRMVRLPIGLPLVPIGFNISSGSNSLQEIAGIIWQSRRLMSRDCPSRIQEIRAAQVGYKKYMVVGVTIFELASCRGTIPWNTYRLVIFINGYNKNMVCSYWFSSLFYSDDLISPWMCNARIFVSLYCAFRPAILVSTRYKHKFV